MNEQTPQTEEVEIIPTGAIEAIQRAEIDIQIATAQRYKRVLSKVKQDMLAFATLDQETAESCFYKLPRGGKIIEGPSIRLAEIAISCYGNLRAGSRVISTVTTGPEPHVVIQSMCHDLEKNTAITIEKRRRITKKKSKTSVDEDDINLAVNAGTAIALRDAVFKVIPLALVKPVMQQAKMVAIGDAKTLVERRGRAFESFAKMGVQAQRVLDMLQKKSIEDVDLNDLETLFGLRTAIKEGNTTIDDAFPKVEEAATVERFAGKKEAAPTNGGNLPSEPPPNNTRKPTPTAFVEGKVTRVDPATDLRASLAAIIEAQGNTHADFIEALVSEGVIAVKNASSVKTLQDIPTGIVMQYLGTDGSGEAVKLSLERLMTERKAS